MIIIIQFNCYHKYMINLISLWIRLSSSCHNPTYRCLQKIACSLNCPTGKSQHELSEASPHA